HRIDASVPHRQLAAAPRFDAASLRRNRLAGVAQGIRVEDGAQAAHLLEIRLGEEVGHVRDLLQPDAVLAREAAPHVDDEPEDLVAGGPHALDGSRLALVVEYDRVEVAVAGVEDVRNREPVARLDAPDLLEHLGKTRARYHAVVRVVIRGETAQRAEGLFA